MKIVLVLRMPRRGGSLQLVVCHPHANFTEGVLRKRGGRSSGAPMKITILLRLHTITRLHCRQSNICQPCRRCRMALLKRSAKSKWSRRPGRWTSTRTMTTKVKKRRGPLDLGEFGTAHRMGGPMGSQSRKPLLRRVRATLWPFSTFHFLFLFASSILSKISHRLGHTGWPLGLLRSSAVVGNL